MENLTNRVMVFSVSTDSFFNKEEKAIGDKLMDLRIKKAELEVIKSIEEGNFRRYKNKELHNQLKKLVEDISKKKKLSISEVINMMIEGIDNKVDEKSKKLKVIIDKNKDKRELNKDVLFVQKSDKVIPKSNKVVALFESALTRTLELKSSTEASVNDELIIVKVYHQKIMKDLIHKKFTYNNEEYIYFSSSAGQMKTKKCVFVKKSILNDKRKNSKGNIYTVQDSLLCGLSRDRINNTDIKGEKGVNTNKFLAYLSLLNSATTEWKDFDIHKVLVVPDLELKVKGIVDYIDRDTYEITPNMEKDDLEMNVTDGCGIMLPTVSSKAFQFRINWGKGLLCPFDFIKFIEEANKENPSKNHAIVKDVWGNTHDVIEEGIEILITSSQLKMWKYYRDWEEYKQFFVDYECQAGICNIETETKDIHLSYQYLQSLVNMEESDLEKIAKLTNDDIKNLGSSKEKMLRSLGATEENESKDYLQQALLLHDNLLNDPHVKAMIRNKKAAMVRDARGGKLRVEGKRMFVLPDVYGWCEYLFKGIEDPKGLLRDGEVFSKKMPEGEVDILRSPQLYREHGIRRNITNEKVDNWFVSGGLYISNWDLLSRLLQLDWDGDEVNVCTNKHLIKVGKDAMKGINPLYYEMSVAPVQQIDEDTIYNSLTLAFNGNIGTISNDITKIYNSAGEFTDDKLKAIKLLTMYNNFMIDYSKTNFLPKPTRVAKKLINQYTKGHMPYFFQYAKGYDKENVSEQVVKLTDENGKIEHEHIPTVNKLKDIISNNNIYFRKVADKLDYRVLMSVKNFKVKNQKLYNEVKNTYDKINRGKKWIIDKNNDEYKEDKFLYVSKVIKDKIMNSALTVDDNVTDTEIADILIDYLYKVKKAENKKTLWECYGEILFANLRFNVDGIKKCAWCIGEFKAESHKEKYCSSECRTEGEKENTRRRVEKSRRKAM